jgi:hypothetical protein
VSWALLLSSARRSTLETHKYPSPLLPSAFAELINSPLGQPLRLLRPHPFPAEMSPLHREGRLRTCLSQPRRYCELLTQLPDRQVLILMLDAICHNRGPCSSPSAIACRFRQRGCQRGHRLLGLCSREREVDQITSRIQRYQHDRAIDGHSRSNNVVDDKAGACPSPTSTYTFPAEQLSCRSFDAELLGGGGITSQIEPRPHCITIRSSARGSMAGPSEPLSDANIARASVRTILGNCSSGKANVVLFRQIAEHLLESCYKRSLSL